MSGWPFDPDHDQAGAATAFDEDAWNRTQEARQRAAANRLIVTGLIAMIVGLVLTVGTYESAVGRGGGTYLVAWGPMVWGLITFFRGVMHR
jgi:hypothetical protein